MPRTKTYPPSRTSSHHLYFQQNAFDAFVENTLVKEETRVLAAAIQAFILERRLTCGGRDLVHVDGGEDFPLDVAQEDAVRGVVEDAAEALELKGMQ